MRGPIGRKRPGFAWSLAKGAVLVIIGAGICGAALWYFRLDLERPKKAKTVVHEPAKEATFEVTSNGSPYNVPVDHAAAARQKAQDEENARLRADIAKLQAAAAAKNLKRDEPKPATQTSPPPKEKPVRKRAQAVYVVNSAPPPDTGKAPLHTLPVWQYISAVLENVVVSELEGFFTLTTTRPVWDATRQHVLIPQGRRIGAKARTAQLLLGNERIPGFALSTRLEDGTEIDLGDAPIMDATGTNGLRAEVDNHTWRLIWTSLAIGALNGGRQLIQQEMQEIDGEPVATGVMNQGASVTRRQLGRAQDTRPTLTSEAGQLVNILMTKSLTLPSVEAR